MMRVRLTQIDGKLPNLALMKLAHWHRTRGDEVHFTKQIQRDLFEPHYDAVYGSAIFSFSRERVEQFRHEFPAAVVGGTYNISDNRTVEQIIGLEQYEHYDYSIYPRFDASLGFTQRGCRLKCGFCVVPKKEGKARSVNTIADIWRGDPYPRHLHLMDNDFFGQPREQWQARIDEIRAGKFKVCLNQGINVRMLNEESAEALASLELTDDTFRSKRIYTAWDNIGDEKVFFRGVELLLKHGFVPATIFVYMLVGYDKRETWERVLDRLYRMDAYDLRPYPMVYGDRARRLPLGGCTQRIEKKTLGDFQSWVVRRTYRHGRPFEAFAHNACREDWYNAPPEQERLQW
jgi:hypothetical protein